MHEHVCKPVAVSAETISDEQIQIIMQVALDLDDKTRGELLGAIVGAVLGEP